MYEQPQDLIRLQEVLDRSYERAGEHLRSIFIPKKRLSAEALVELMTGMQLLTLATVTAKGEPRVAPVDGHFFRGEFWFGSAPDSARFRHIRKRPQVSANHIRGETLAVVVHGTAHIVDLKAPENAAFVDHCHDVYGAAWDDFGAPATYARIEPRIMFANTLGDWDS